MDDLEAVMVLASLAQPTRLQAFRRLVEHEPDGIAAGELARLLAVPQNTMSSHLAVLAHAGLVTGTRHSRSIVYRPDLDRIRGLTLHLLQDCCGGRAEVCAPVVDVLNSCCSSESAECAPTTSSSSAQATRRARSSRKAFSAS